MATASRRPCFTVPRQWTRSIQTALIHVMSLAKYALVYSRSWAADSRNARVRLAAKSDTFQQEIALLPEEIRIKDARLASIAPAQRPHHQPTERLAILELRAACGWCIAQSARVFHLTQATIASWCKRLDEEGSEALLRTSVPVNKFPEFVHYSVQRLQTLCPRLGKVKIAQTLARARLHLGATTIGRMRRQPPPPKPTQHPEPARAVRRVTAKYPNHLWHVDLTTVPTSTGFWVSWLPFALPQCWPFCWWLAVVIDHYSRRVMGFTAFTRPPTSEQVRHFLGQVIANAGRAPRHLVTDHGTQFSSAGFKAWCRRRDIRHRLGAVGEYGSIAVLERLIRTLKETTRALVLVPLVRRSFQREVEWWSRWYNSYRPHTTLKGATPDEVYFGRRLACRNPRFEPRPNWPRPAPCARPPALVKGQPGVKLELSVAFVAQRRHLPCVTLTRAA